MPPTAQQSQQMPANPFATALRELLAVPRLDGRRVRAGELAKELGVNPSLVAHWMSGKRLPPSNSRYFPAIAKALHLTEAETERLQSAYDLALHPPVQSAPVTTPLLPGTTVTSLQKLARLPIKGQFAWRPVDLPEDYESSEFPTDLKLLPDEEATTRMVIRLFAKAEEIDPHSQAIYLSYFGAKTLLPNEPVEKPENWWFRQALRRALSRGWDVYYLIRLNDDLQRSIDIVEAMQWFVGSLLGAYKPYYFREGEKGPLQGTLPVPYGFCIVPGVGAVLGFATKQADRIDKGFFLRDAGPYHEHVQLLYEHAERFRQTPDLMVPLLKTYPNDPHGFGNDDFQDAIARAEAHPGGRTVLKSGLSAITRPASYYAPDSKWLSHLAPEEQRRAISRYWARQESFRQHVPWYSYYDIAPRSAILKLVEKGEYARDDAPLRRAQETANVTPSVKDKWDHLTNVIHMLKTYPNYNLALLDAEEEPGTLDTFWEAIGDHVVLLESWHPTDSGAEEMANLEITEPTIVRAFQAYGQLLWSKVKPANRHKPTVIAWLETFVRDLEERNPEELAQRIAERRASSIP
jgi:hypothetical protein